MFPELSTSASTAGTKSRQETQKTGASARSPPPTQAWGDGECDGLAKSILKNDAFSDRKGVHAYFRNGGKSAPELASADRAASRHVVERRIIGSSLEVREMQPDETKDGKPLPVLQGYAARFNTRSLPLGVMGFREEIDPKAFDETLAKDPDCRYTFNHNPNKVYGRTRAGTLKLSCDDMGLRFEVHLPKHHDAEGLAESIKRGDVTQCSFSFRTLDDDWSRDDDGTIVRRLLKVDIDNGEVAAVTFPAYPDTDVSVRSLDDTISRDGAERLGLSVNQTEIVAAAAAREREIKLAKLE